MVMMVVMRVTMVTRMRILTDVMTVMMADNISGEHLLSAR
jgi:hypothetical protein